MAQTRCGRQKPPRGQTSVLANVGGPARGRESVRKSTSSFALGGRKSPLSIAGKARRNATDSQPSSRNRCALHENARSAYPWLMMQPKGTHTSAKSQVSIAHKQLVTSRFEIGYALRAFSCEAQAPPRIAGGFLGAAERTRLKP